MGTAAKTHMPFSKLLVAFACLVWLAVGGHVKKQKAAAATLLEEAVQLERDVVELSRGVGIKHHEEDTYTSLEDCSIRRCGPVKDAKFPAYTTCMGWCFEQFGSEQSTQYSDPDYSDNDHEFTSFNAYSTGGNNGDDWYSYN